MKDNNFLSVKRLSSSTDLLSEDKVINVNMHTELGFNYLDINLNKKGGNFIDRTNDAVSSIQIGSERDSAKHFRLE